MMRMMRKRFFIGTALSLLFAGCPMIEPVSAKTAPEDAKPVADTRRPAAGGFIRFNGFLQASGKSVTYPAVSAMASSALAKSKRLQRFDLYGRVEIGERTRIIDYPILSISEGDMTASQLFMPYDGTEVEILGMTTPVAEAAMAYNILDNELQFRWTRRTPAEIRTGDTLAFLKLYLKHKPNHHIDRYFHINPDGFKVTRGSDIPTDDDWRVALPEVALYYEEDPVPDSLEAPTDNPVDSAVAVNPAESGNPDAGHDKKETMLKQQGGQTSRFEILSVIPNPMKSWADITYSIFGDCSVRLRLYSLLGEEIMTIVNSGRQTGLYRHNIAVSDVPAGVYILRLETCQEDVQEAADVMKIVVQN